jgi:ferredoxin
MGPKPKDGVIRFAPISAASELPWGIADEQSPGRYRLTEGPPNRAFFWTTAPQAAKAVFFPPQEALWTARRDDSGRVAFSLVQPDNRPLAFIGLRACDLAARDLHDRHFAARGDPWYRSRRAQAFIVAVNCARSTGTCFCASTGDGPALTSGHDLLLDELDDGYLVLAGSDRGAAVLAKLGLAPAPAAMVDAAARQTAEAARQQHRTLPAGDLPALLEAHRQTPAWEAIAHRCLACGNCTAVCPSCFCHRHTEEPALDASESVHGRDWDSCFSEGHSLMHGRPHRPGISHRYRQWVGHKFGAWHAQYGRSGCTGCGRCITWCPVGIDVTESLAAVTGEKPS